MRHRTFFDESIFLVSFSVALGVLALIIPAHSTPTTEIDANQAREYIDLCDSGADQPDCVAAVRFGDTGDRAVAH
jgi:hypothetical protein